ncbi:MGDG synthase family glycosyltransferase [Paenibacillus sp. MMO-58]|uniref:MGDG synthase family glycosyltransferase n=1 Tax=Paenibacillus sp. MMO-58 TaxID=3081290 RepID=UPI00301B6929
MKSDSKIVIVYSSFGDGHVKAAHALEESLLWLGYHNVTLIDLFDATHPRLNSAVRMLYLNSTIYTPRAYGLFYDVTNINRPSRVLSRMNHFYGMKKMKKEWEIERPALIIHTFPYLAADELRYELGHDIPTVTVITDYVLHSRWLHENTSQYCVASEQLKMSLNKAGVPDHKITVTGIPIRSTFKPSSSRAWLCERWGFDAGRSRVLVMAGAYGVQRSVKEMIDTILQETDSDAIIVCGKNEKLQMKLASVFLDNNRVSIIGYTNEIHELMAISDCLLSKAGGITLTEALAMTLPTIVYKPLPGQEKGNAVHLSSVGAIGISYKPEQLAEQLRHALSPAGAKAMKAAINAVYCENSALRIAAEAVKLTDMKGQRRPGIVPQERKAVHVHV